MNKEIPSYLELTYTMLSPLFKGGIGEGDYYTVIAVLRNGMMSDRSLAELISLFNGGRYTKYFYDVSHEFPYQGGIRRGDRRFSVKNRSRSI